MIRRCLSKIVVAASLSGFAYVPTSGLAASADLELLSRLLAPANLMLMLGNFCAAENPSFLTATAGRRGDLRFYAQEVKDEVSQDLSDADVLLVLRKAADIAKAEGLKSIRMLQSPDPIIEIRMITTWCNTSVKSLVENYIRTHDERHTAFKELLVRAKAGSNSDRDVE